MCVCVFVCVCMYMYIYSNCMCVCVCVCMYTYISVVPSSDDTQHRMHLTPSSDRTICMHLRTYTLGPNGACACACVCGQDSTQEGVFDEVKNFVQSALDGYNVSLLAYGQVFVCVRVYACIYI